MPNSFSAACAFLCAKSPLCVTDVIFTVNRSAENQTLPMRAGEYRYVRQCAFLPLNLSNGSGAASEPRSPRNKQVSLNADSVVRVV